MPHPDTPVAKQRANRLPSGGKGMGPGWGGAPKPTEGKWPEGVLQPHTGRKSTIRGEIEAVGGALP